MYVLRVKDHFDAAHFLPWHEGKCKNLHGHRWEVEVVLEADELDENGVVVDFGEVKKSLEYILPDHTNLNEAFETPTAEVLAKELYEAFDKDWEIVRDCGDVRDGVALKEVTVWESPECSVTYRPSYDSWDLPPNDFFEKSAREMFTIYDELAKQGVIAYNSM